MRKKPEPIRSDIVTDVSRMLDFAGVDGVQARRLDSLMHSGISAQGLVDFAAAMHRRMGCRIGFGELLAEFTGAEMAA